MSVCLLYSQYLGRSRAFRWHIYWHDDTYTDMTHLYVSCASDLHPKSQVIFTFQLRSKAASTTTQLWSALLQCSLWRHRLNSRRFSSNRPGWPVLAQSGSDLPQRGQIRDFFRSDFRTFWLIVQKKSRICPIWGKSAPLWAQIWPVFSRRLVEKIELLKTSNKSVEYWNTGTLRLVIQSTNQWPTCNPDT